MDKRGRRKPTTLIIEIYQTIKSNPRITMSTLERKAGTNPTSLREYCKVLEKFGLIKIQKTSKTTVLIPVN